MEETTGNFGATKGDAMTFTDKKPTVPGVYLYKYAKDSVLEVFQIVDKNGVLMAKEGGALLDLALYGGLWSSRLVPVEEVELAYHEGVENKRNQFLSDHPRDWENSRARRVVEGKETP